MPASRSCGAEKRHRYRLRLDCASDARGLCQNPTVLPPRADSRRATALPAGEQSSLCGSTMGGKSLQIAISSGAQVIAPPDNRQPVERGEGGLIVNRIAARKDRSPSRCPSMAGSISCNIWVPSRSMIDGISPSACQQGEPRRPVHPRRVQEYAPSRLAKAHCAHTH